MDGSQCRELRQRLGLTQARLAFQCQLDAAQLCRWEQGDARLRPMQVAVIRDYLAEQLLAAKEQFRTLKLPEVAIDRALETVQ